MRQDSASPLPLELALLESATAARSDSAPSSDVTGAEEHDAARRSSLIPERERRSSRSSVQEKASTEDHDAVRPRRQPERAVESVPGSAAPGPGAVDAPEADGGAVAGPPSGPQARLDTNWGSVVRSLRHTGKRFKLGALLRGCRQRDVSDGLITLRFSYVSHVDRMRQELEDPETRKIVKEVFAGVMEGPYEVEVSLAADEDTRPNKSAAQQSHLVRAVEAMGGRVVDEQEEQ